jgi:hypothetical protein
LINVSCCMQSLYWCHYAINTYGCDSFSTAITPESHIDISHYAITFRYATPLMLFIDITPLTFIWLLFSLTFHYWLRQYFITALAVTDTESLIEDNISISSILIEPSRHAESGAVVWCHWSWHWYYWHYYITLLTLLIHASHYWYWWYCWQRQLSQRLISRLHENTRVRILAWHWDIALSLYHWLE